VIIDADARGVDPSCADVHKRGGGRDVITNVDMRVDTREVVCLCHDMHRGGAWRLRSPTRGGEASLLALDEGEGLCHDA
jgi:hypothetical protein